MITKPIDPAELKAKVCRTLCLETSYKYFQQRDGVLALMLPKDFQPSVAQEVTTHLEAQLVSTVDAGGDKLIVDLNAVETASLPIIQLVDLSHPGGRQVVAALRGGGFGSDQEPVPQLF